MRNRVAEKLNCKCPSCETDLQITEYQENKTMIVEDRVIQAAPLALTQPLAYDILKLVQVKYKGNGPEEDARIGDYAERTKDRVDHKLGSKGDNEGNLKVNLEDDRSRAGPTPRGDQSGAHHARTLMQQAQQPGEVDLPDLERAMERCEKLKKQANAKFNRGDIEGARVLYSEGLALISYFPRNDDDVRIMVASLYSNRAVTFFRERLLSTSIEDCNRSLELDPKSEKTYIRKWRALSATGDTKAATQCLKDGLVEIPGSQKLKQELNKPIAPRATSSRERAYSDMNYSIASTSQLDAGGSRTTYEEMMTVVEDPHRASLERAERLKKQANAKFNKGDIEAARGLYSDALGCIPSNVQNSNEVRSLLAMLYSNRAVTFFRDKMYSESLLDCNKAIELDPDAEKSYIRKSRALAGLERHDEAYSCLEAATKKLPNSKKLSDELAKASTEKDENEEVKDDNHKFADFADYNNSLGSFDFDIMPNKVPDESGGVIGVVNDVYAEALDLADKLKRNANAKFNHGDIAGARLLYSEALDYLPNDAKNLKVRASLASLYSNRAVTFFRENKFDSSARDCDKAIELDPKSAKSYIRKARALTSLQRFSDVVKCLEAAQREIPGSIRLEEELLKARKQQEAEDLKTGDKMANLDDFQISHNEFDHNPNDHFSVTPSANRPSLGSVKEGMNQEFPLPFSANKEIERAEKLKKQANARLNKGDIAGARALYGEGLACLPPSNSETVEGRELAASLYSNRAVTFFREKQFAATVSDCNKSLELDPKHEKSYIRKWRALMALGDFNLALNCLEGAVVAMPDSDRLSEELTKATEQKELLAKVHQLMSNGEYQEARDTLKPLIKTTDNVNLWLAAARADAWLGFTESALERVNKVLLFNAKHAEGLQVRGYAKFLAGEMDHGTSLLKEALEVGTKNENYETSELLENCQRTFSAFSKGQGRLRRGRHKEAIDQFTFALDEGGNVPKDSPLYSLLLIKRAEASLLAKQFEEALEDCTEAITLKSDNITAWTVKVEVCLKLGRLQEARDELAEARRTWGAGNDTINRAYKKIDFELRLKRADDDLHRIVAAVESGMLPDILDGEPIHMSSEESKSVLVKSRSKSTKVPPSGYASQRGTNDKRRSDSRSRKRDEGGGSRTNSRSKDQRGPNANRRIEI